MAIAVVTRGYDNTRGGVNASESALTASAVSKGKLRRLFSLVMTGDARGMDCQPLVVPDVTLADGDVQEVIFCATMANRVYAFDAETGGELWMRELAPPVTGDPAIDMHMINDHWGVLSTPVIDRDTATMYAVAWTSDDGSVARAQHFLYALSLRDGSDLHRRAPLGGASYDPGHDLPVEEFRSAERKQRPALLLTSVAGVKTVFIGFGSIRETGADARGWVIACSTDPLEVTASWATTARGEESSIWGGGIWQAGAGLAADGDGFIYAMTGNGSFDGVTDFAESFVKLRYDAGGTNPSLTLAGWWTPWTDKVRTSQQTVPAVAGPLPSNFRAFALGFGFDPADMDLGSGGPVLAPTADAVVGAGKDGILYVVNRTSMGNTTPSDFPAAQNYKSLKSPPIFFTYFPGFGISAAPADIRQLDDALGGYFDNRSHHLHGSPVYWDSPDLGPVLYCWGENGNLRAWSIANTGAVTFLANSAELASPQAPQPPGGMPGGMLTLSADGGQPHTGIVWATIPYWDANMKVGPGRLLAYDATQFGTFPDGSKQLRVLWDSEAANLPFIYNKFTPPVVANGRVMVTTYDGRVDVYGLA
jgi:hypothetical protein